jgi:hypothetical protein
LTHQWHLLFRVFNPSPDRYFFSRTRFCDFWGLGIRLSGQRKL